MAKYLTKANIRGTGIIEDNDFDFDSNGIHYKGFSYKGIPLTQYYSRKYGQLFLRVRVDYIINEHDFAINDFLKSEAYKLYEKWNGTYDELNIGEFVETLEKIIKIINDLDEKYKVTDSLKEKVYNNLKNMLKKKEDFFNDIRNKMSKICWWNMEDVELNKLKRYTSNIENSIKHLKDILTKIEADKLPDNQYKNYNNKEIYGSNFYIEEINVILNKYEN